MNPADPPSTTDSPEEAASKDAFFQQLARVSDAMIAAHGKDFAMGSLVLAARFIAEGDARAKAAAEAAAAAPSTQVAA